MRMAHALVMYIQKLLYRAISSFETVLENVVMNMEISEEPVVIEGDDAALILERVSNDPSHCLS